MKPPLHRDDASLAKRAKQETAGVRLDRRYWKSGDITILDRNRHVDLFSETTEPSAEN